MEKHPIPQNVTGFEFKLIGDMTVKQFAYVAAPSVASYLIYLLPAHFLIRWSLIVVFLVVGFSLAFVPVAGRPIDKMIFYFIKALFSHNQYVFRKPSFQAPSQAQVPAAQTSTPIVKMAPVAPPAQSVPPPTPPPTVPSASSLPPSPQPSVQVAAPSSQPDPRLQAISVSVNEAAGTTKTDQPIPTVLTKPASPTPQVTVPPPFTAPRKAGVLIPDAPNVVSGVVKDALGDVLQGVIVEIKDQTGMAARAFKTNRIGQFAGATSLEDGTYTVEVEDPLNRFSFEVIKIILDGKVILPLEIMPIDQRAGLRKDLFGAQNL